MIEFKKNNMVQLLQTAGAIRTNIFKDLGVSESNADQFFDTLKNAALVDRIGTVADISAAIVYLASESFVTGTTLIVDGGLSCVGIPGKSKFIATLSNGHVFFLFEWTKKVQNCQNSILVRPS